LAHRAADALAYCILLDQFPRNMFRGDRAASPRTATPAPRPRPPSRAAGTCVPEPERQFFYMPLEHSENLVDQDRAVRLFVRGCPRREQPPPCPRHREQIRRFGRFPHAQRGAAAADTPEEQEFLARGGYPALVEEMRARTAPETQASLPRPPRYTLDFTTGSALRPSTGEGAWRAGPSTSS
jgi:uncharacterized protein (DUF924 family)